MKRPGWLAIALRLTLASILVPVAAAAQPVSFTHLAGSLGGPGLADGTGTSADFYHPYGVAVDGSGNVIVADTYNHSIRKVTPAGVVTTLAGSTAFGSADGTGSAASFRFPGGVAVDRAGNVYVADSRNYKIRKITPDGVVTTLAGSGSSGSADGTGTAASFNLSYGVAVDGSGNVYVADSGNNKVRKVTPGGSVSTLAGSGAAGSLDGAGTAATFNFPAGIAVDSSGNAFVGDRSSNKVRKVAPGGAVTTVAGTGTAGSADGPGIAATFSMPYGVAVDGSGNVYVADSISNKVRKITPAGIVSTFAGSGSYASTDGTGTAAAFGTPHGVATDPAGNVYVADTYNDKVRKIAPAGAVTTLAGSGATGTVDGAGALASFANPSNLAADGSGNVYVVDSDGNKLRKVTPGGVVTTLAGSGNEASVDGTGSAASFDGPWGVAVDGDGNVYVSELYGKKIRKVTPAGLVTTLAGSGSTGSVDGPGPKASFNYPYGLAVDGAGNLYVADFLSEKIRKVTPGGTVSTLAGSGLQGAADGPAATASFNHPLSVALDSSGTVYVLDQNNKVRKVTPAGVVTSVAGSGAAGSDDGTGAAASFRNGWGLAADAAGNVYVADTGNNTIRKVTPAGVVTTVGGSGSVGHADGTGTVAAFAGPNGVAVDGSGNLYVADSLNNAIRLGRNLGSATCAPDGTHLCLLGGQFRISADYADYSSGHGTGNAVYLTPDTGYFWFFKAANVEAVAKMVSFCGAGSNNMALYAGGLTDLGVTLHVADTRSGMTKDYTNPLGTGFTLIRDGPFGCPAATAEVGEAELTTAGRGGDPIVETTERPAPDLPGPSACTPDATTLCLLGGRFQVRAAYQAYSGSPGIGQAVSLTSDTGYFWFFRASNVETVVKMVSFCGGGSNNVGVYAGGLTDIQVTLTVTDVLTGLVKTYTNPLGTLFQLVRDGPFSCP
jgi:sugar lactone lactonase YvrE